MWRVGVVLSLLIFMDHAFGHILRSDLQKPFHKIICQQSSEDPPAVTDLWKHGVYDAGAKVYILGSSKKERRTGNQLQSMALKFAGESHHLGYAFGKCHSTKLWIVTTPSPFQWNQSHDSLRIQSDDISTYCQWFRIDYANSKYGKPRKLFKGWGKDPSKPIIINTKLLEPGTISLTCEPHRPHWLGPMLWSLRPIKKPADATPKFDQNLDGMSRTTALHNWVNHTRAEMGLNPLSVVSQPIQAMTRSLISQNLSVMHHRDDIRKVSRDLKTKKGRFLGENRVQARTLKEATWLLWNSPRHRSLILNSKATHLSTMSKRLKSEELSVMVFAKF